MSISINGINVDNPKTLSELYKIASLGQNLNVIRTVEIFANNPALAANVEETIWTVGGVWVPLTNAEIIDFTSTSANDTVGGSGANAVLVVGLDANYNTITEVVPMAGLGTASTTQEFLRINYMAVAAFGASSTNEGFITATASISATPQSGIDVQHGVSQDCKFTVPDGWTAFPVNIGYSLYRAPGASATTRNGEISTIITLGDTGLKVINPTVGLSTNGTETFTSVDFIPDSIPPKSDLEIRITASASDTAATCNSNLLLIKGTFPGLIENLDTSTP